MYNKLRSCDYIAEYFGISNNRIQLKYYHGTLYDFIYKRVQLTYDDILFYFKQLLDVIKCMHKYGVIHRDIKVENICLSDDGNIKVIDFEHAETSGFNDQSPTYLIPGLDNQVGIEKRMYYNVDYFCLGLVLYNMIIKNDQEFESSDKKTQYTKESWNEKLNAILDTDYFNNNGVGLKNIKNLLYILLDWNINQENIIDKIESNDWVKKDISDLEPPFIYKNDEWISQKK